MESPHQSTGRAKLFVVASSFFLCGSFQALYAQGFTANVVGDVAFIEVQLGSDIQPAFDFLETYIDANSNVNSGVVDLTSSTTFAEIIDVHDDTALNIREGVTLTIDSEYTGWHFITQLLGILPV